MIAEDRFERVFTLQVEVLVIGRHSSDKVRASFDSFLGFEHAQIDLGATCDSAERKLPAA